MRIFGSVIVGLTGLVAVFALSFGLEWAGIAWKGFLGPKHAAVERAVFLETRSYNEGMIQQLTRYRLQYLRATSPEEKAAIASTVRVMFAEYNPDSLNSDLRNFLREVNR